MRALKANTDSTQHFQRNLVDPEIGPESSAAGHELSTPDTVVAVSGSGLAYPSRDEPGGSRSGETRDLTVPPRPGRESILAARHDHSISNALNFMGVAQNCSMLPILWVT
jgi:hypothetical protein